MSWAILIDYRLYFEGFQSGGQHLGTHNPAHAKKFGTRGEAELFIKENNLTVGARPVLLYS